MVVNPGVPNQNPQSPHAAHTGVARVPERKTYRAALVETTELAEKQARDDADHAMTESLEDRQKGWFKRTATRIWKHNIAEGFYRQKKYNTAIKKIRGTDNLYANEESGAIVSEAMDALMQRFTSDARNDLLKDSEKQTLRNASPVGNAQVNNLIKSFASGNMTEAAFTAHKKQILAGINQDYSNGEKMFSDNLLKIAQEVKDKYTHSRNIADLDIDVELTLGQARDRLNSEAQLKGFDKAWSSLKRSGFGKTLVGSALTSEASTLVAAGVYSAGKFLGNKLLRNKVAQAVTFGGTGVLAGLIAGRNESVRLSHERAQHSRERAKGKKITDDMERRKEIEKFQYSTRGAKEIIGNLQVNLARIKSGNATPAQIQEALKELSDIESRIKVGGQHKADLVQYSRFDQVQQEGLKIDLLRAQMKTALGQADPGYAAKLATLMNHQSDEMLAGDGGLEAKDKLFRSMKRSKSWKKAGKTMLFGSLASLGTHEIFNTFPGNTDSVLSEGAKHVRSVFRGHGWKGDPNMGLHQTGTPILALSRYLTHGKIHMPFGKGAPDFLCGNTHLRLPEGAQIIDNHDDTYSILGPDNTPLLDHEKLMFNPDGSLSEDTQKMLAGHGMYTSSVVTGGIENQSMSEYVRQHGANFEKIHYGRWHENGTSISDENELRTHWGGLRNNGIDANGHPTLNVGKMTSDGSWHVGPDGKLVQVDANEIIKSGKAEALLAFTRDTQHDVIRIPIDSNGNLVVPPGKMADFDRFFEHDAQGKLVMDHGHPVPIGKFLSIAHQTGLGKDGKPVFEVFGTLVGKKGDFTVPVDTRITNIKFDLELPRDVDIPPFVWVNPRQPLERLENPDAVADEPGPVEDVVLPAAPLYYGYGDPTLTRERWPEDFSPRLKADPEAKLDPVEEAAWYFEDQKRRYPGYVESELPNLTEQNKNPLGKNVEGVLCLAVAGHQEHKNIYRTLETYRVQQEKDGSSMWKGDDSKYEIFIYVNWPKGKSPQLTLDEIERFKSANPNIPVRVYSEEITNGKVEVGWYKKKIFDAALQKNLEREVASSNPKKRDISIIANDADMTFSSTKYLSNISETMSSPENSKYDGILGRYDLDPSVYEKYPTFHSAMRFWQYIEAVMRSKHEIVGTQGRNTIMRGASYAAIGGNRTRDFWGDLEFGQMFDDARKRHAVGYENKSWVMVDPRREIDKFKSGEAIAWTWGDFNTRDVRGNTPVDVPENLDVNQLASLPENDPMVVQFKDRLQYEIQEIIKLGYMWEGYNPQENGGSNAFRREIIAKASEFLGVGVNIFEKSDGQLGIEITDTQKLRKGLNVYKNESRKDTKVKNHPLK